jgi:hypothetical protein
MSVPRELLVSFCGLLVATALFGGSEPVTVSPGSATGALIEGRCPTFSWGEVEGARSYELVVYRLAEGEEEAQPVLRRSFPGSVDGWTPALDSCLERGAEYAWSVRAVGPEEPSDWSAPSLFEVSAGPSEAEFEEALQVVRGYLASSTSVPAEGERPGHNGTIAEASSRPPARQTGRGRAAESATAAIPLGTVGVSLEAADTPIVRLEQDDSLYSAQVWDLAGNEAAFMVRDNTNSNALPFRVEAGAPHSSLVISSSGVVAAEVASFSGDGSLLTNLAPASLQPGTAAINITGNAAPASLFGSFGGEGTIDMTVSGIQNLGTTVAEYQNLTIPAGSTLVVDKGFALIGVSGTCDIAGRIDANGKGRAGGALVSGKNLPGLPGHRATPEEVGYGMSGSLSAAAVPFAVSGAGGGGGGSPTSGGVDTALLARGGDGGGAAVAGGRGGCEGCPWNVLGHGEEAGWNPDTLRLVTGGSVGGETDPRTRTDAFAGFLLYPGAGGGSGGVGYSAGESGKGGNGGGVIYLECGALSLTGSIEAYGAEGEQALWAGAGGGGGGGGGVVLVRTRSVVSDSGSINVDPGEGGAGAAPGGGDGGLGGDGYWDIVEFP